ncbi:MAG: BatD family protein [Polyangia bacterium]
MTYNKWPITALLAASVGLGGTALADPALQLRPSHITMGQTASLRIRSDDGSSPGVPTIDGLDLESAGQSTEMTDINGVVSQHTFTLYRIVPTHPGHYALALGADRVQLDVSPAGAGIPGPATATTTTRTDAASLAFMRVTLPKKKAYVGEAIPVTFKAYFKPGTEVTLTGPPALGSTSFTVSELADKPVQNVETIGGVPYRTASWAGVVTAALPGHFTSASTLPVSVRYREQTHRAFNPFGGMLTDEDGFPDLSSLRAMMQSSAFGGDIGDIVGPVQQRDLVLRAGEQPLEILALPTAGRPADFSGAVGHFELHASLTPPSGAAFEPMKLGVVVSGHGSFDRVAYAGLSTTDSWKTYPVTVAPSKSRDSKTFEQAVVPRTSGDLPLPAVSFSYFDPISAKYVTTTTSPIVAHVSPAARAQPSEVSSAVGSSAVASSAAPTTGPIVADHHASTLTPVYARAWFWLIQLAIGLAIMAVFIQRVLAGRGPSRRAQRRQVQSALTARKAAMHRAADAGDGVAFFVAARDALQSELAMRWGIPPEQVTATEVEARIGPAGAGVVAAFDAADRATYGGIAPQGAALKKWCDVIDRELVAPEARP